MKNNVLIIIDMLNDFISRQGALYCGASAEAIVPFIAQRLDTYRRSKDAVIFLQDSHDKDDAEFKKFPPHCVAGAWGNQIIEELSPVKGEIVIAKKRYSGFYQTRLESILEELRPVQVEVVGVCTSICVMDTVGGLANRDYSIRVPLQGVADFDPGFHEFALARMKKLYGAEVS
ncbi:MAG: cysteine hydrolase [Desulfobacteraceae bacterium]|nr:cysteine hydrolase [Desulfobacteraceae bacterium]